MKNKILSISFLLGFYLLLGACAPNKFISSSESPPIDVQTLYPRESKFDIIENNKTDILIIIDNSISMEDEQKKHGPPDVAFFRANQRS